MRNAVGVVRSVAVLGGRSEIGLAIAHRLVADGARSVVLGTADGAVPESVSAGLIDAGATEVEVVAFDIAAPNTHARAVAEITGRVGDLDVVVDAAGVLGSAAEHEADPVAAAESVGTNFGGHVSALLRLAELLREQGHGTLVVLSSVAGVRVRKANYVYGAAKAGLDGFAHGLGDRLDGSGARVVVVRPGFVRTKMTAGMPDAPFPTTADEVARVTVEGLRAGKDLIWAPPILGPVFGLMRLIPRPIWRRLPR